MALAQQTDILLLDEPTTFLDVSHQVDVLDLLTDLNRQRGTTIVMVLHDLNLAARYADHLIARVAPAGCMRRATRRGAHRPSGPRGLRHGQPGDPGPGLGQADGAAHRPAPLAADHLDSDRRPGPRGGELMGALPELEMRVTARWSSG